MGNLEIRSGAWPGLLNSQHMFPTTIKAHYIYVLWTAAICPHVGFGLTRFGRDTGRGLNSWFYLNFS
ncbi:hypothetical protein DsansV1_C22g0170811 [Dioscorea sansibarensis]